MKTLARKAVTGDRLGLKKGRAHRLQIDIYFYNTKDTIRSILPNNRPNTLFRHKSTNARISSSVSTVQQIALSLSYTVNECSWSFTDRVGTSTLCKAWTVLHTLHRGIWEFPCLFQCQVQVTNCSVKMCHWLSELRHLICLFVWRITWFCAWTTAFRNT